MGCLQKSRIPLVGQDTYAMLYPLLRRSSEARTWLGCRAPSPACPAGHLILRVTLSSLHLCVLPGKFKPRLSKEQEAETISPCIASAMIQRPALAKLSGTEVARSSAIRAESLQQLPWDGLDLVLQTFLELHLTPTMLLRLFLHLQPWICSPWAQERSQAVRASAGLFMFYRFKAITKWPIRT
ncbi:unnamed protein product [Eretmochelys imbricata]